MILEYGDMWQIYDKTDLFLITANSTLNSRGELVMGAGIAKQAKYRYPQLPKMFGTKIIRHKSDFYGLMVCWEMMPEIKIGLFQTKYNWEDKSPPNIIFKSTYELLVFAEHYTTMRVDLNFPGIGFGGLTKAEVMPIVSILPDSVHIWEYR